MAGELEIDRTFLSLDPLVISNDETDGVTLDREFSMGTVTWRKATSEQPNVPGRTMGDFTRDTSTVTGGITCYGSTPTELQTRIGIVIAALVQVDPDLGFPDDGYLMTYRHIDGSDTATYQWRCTEPADCTLGGSPDGAIADDEMASLIQPVKFQVVRKSIPVQGPI